MGVRPIFNARRGALVGVILAQGAPLGWYLLARAFPAIDQGFLLYLYLEAATAGVMAALGYLLGRRTEELVRLNSQLAVLAGEDALMGIFNARILHLELEREVARARRTGRTLSLVLLDLDHFKQVNDLYGHLVGDQVLAALGKLLRGECRQGDLPARYGGEEIAMLLPETELPAAVKIAERLRERIASNADGAFPVHVTASFGAAQWSPGDSPVGLFAKADSALYQAKEMGRNRVAAAPAGDRM